MDIQLALDGVWGVDLNPFAVAIARFRLVIAAAHVVGLRSIEYAPGWDICNPLDLGPMSETHFVLDASRKNHFNRMLGQSGQPHPTAADLRRWTDQPDDRGLSRDVPSLLILVYADQTNRTFVRYGSNHTPGLDDLPRPPTCSSTPFPSRSTPRIWPHSPPG